jgi:hypothetical protein
VKRLKMDGWREFNVVIFDDEFYFQDASEPLKLYGPVTADDAADILEGILLGQPVDYIELPMMMYVDFGNEDMHKAMGTRRPTSIT